MTLKVLDLFSGIGGFSLGLERTGGFDTVAFCEIDVAAQRVLKHHWPHVPIYEDIKELTGDRLRRDGIEVDVICGGFPCQDISNAGLRGGIIAERSGLWGEYARLIQDLRPQYVIIENVTALLSQGLTLVLQNLCEIGYCAEWNCIPASSLGFSHQRDRIWIVAYPLREGPQGGLSGWAYSERESITGCLRHSLSSVPERWIALPGQDPYPQEPPRTTPTKSRVGRAANGLPTRMDRIKQLGNAVVPQIPELLGRAILNRERNEI